jgi:hypothetical protein
VPTTTPPKKPVRVGELIRKRLQEIKKSTAELAEAVHVPVEYIDDIIHGRRRAPSPGRTDLYERATPFLRLGRNDLATAAQTELAGEKRGRGPKAAVSRQLLSMCEPKTAAELERRKAEKGGAELEDLSRRLLDVTQVAVRRVLYDQTGMRIAAAHSGSTYLAMRLSVLDFLDATPESLTLQQVEEYVRPRVDFWDMDLETGVLRVVMRAQDQRDSQGRRPAGRARADSAPWTRPSGNG